MSVLIQMRQRMKAIETIKKITHAMRLISMSNHSRLRSKKRFLQEYTLEINKLFNKVRLRNPQWTHHFLQEASDDSNSLYIIIGSQKGLCGSFNLSAYLNLEKKLRENSHNANSSLVVIGKKMAQLTLFTYGKVIKTIEQFNQVSLEKISHEIAEIVLHGPKPFSSVKIIYNYPKSFFNQVPTELTLIPFQTPEKNGSSTEILFPQPTDHILEVLLHKMITTTIKEALFESLLAEQSARFIAMDSSTRNAATLLDTMKINYNKVRQSKITRELTDLVGSFS